VQLGIKPIIIKLVRVELELSAAHIVNWGSDLDTSIADLTPPTI